MTESKSQWYPRYNAMLSTKINDMVEAGSP